MARCFSGFAFRRSGGTAGNFAGIIEGGVQVHVYLGVNAAGKLTVMRGSDLALLGTGTTPIFADTWYYLELRAVIDPTVGALELRVDGAVDITLANANTQAGATGKIDGFLLPGVTVDPASTSWYVDDLYLADGTGPAPQNYFLGPIKIETLLPQTDGVAPGSNAGLTPSTGVDHGALVDENPANATDYNSSGTIGAKDTVQLSVAHAARRDPRRANRSLRAEIRHGGAAGLRRGAERPGGPGLRRRRRRSADDV